jgi:hypothetical protein
LDVELATFLNRSLVDGQVFRTAQSLAADRPFKPGCDRLGFGFIPVDD